MTYTPEMIREKQDQFHIFNDMLSRWRYDAWCEYIRPSKLILEIGIGTGQITKLLNERWLALIHCVDPNKEKIELSIKKYPRITHYTGRYEDVHFGSLYGTLICSHTLEHVDEPFPFLKKCYLELIDGGVLIVTVPNALALHKRLGELMGFGDPYGFSIQDELEGHKHIFDQYKLAAMVRGAGFEIIAIKGMMLKPFPSVMMQEMLDEEWFRALWKVGQDPALIDYCSSILVVGEKR